MTTRCPACHRPLGRRTLRRCPIDGSDLIASRRTVEHLGQVEVAVEGGGTSLRPVAYELDASSWDQPVTEEFWIRCVLGHTGHEILSALGSAVDADVCDRCRHHEPAFR